MERILIIDDDEELCELVSEYLSVEGLEVETVHDGDSGLAEALQENHDLIILDVMLPRKTVLMYCESYAKNQKFRVLMLTRWRRYGRIVGLEIGADDYLPKPFKPRKLVARLRAILRRIGKLRNNASNLSSEKIEIEDLEISLSGRTAKIAEKKIILTAVEFDLLVALVREVGKVVKKEDLSMDVLERELSPFDRSLDMHISNLRKKLGKHENGEDRIKTIRSVGYIYTLNN